MLKVNDEGEARDSNSAFSPDQPQAPSTKHQFITEQDDISFYIDNQQFFFLNQI